MIYLIDLFCGAGGTSTAAAKAEGVQVIACVNHDPIAIKSHAANHPDCKHYQEDIRTLELTELCADVAEIRSKDPNAKIGLWASLECINFSKAKGGLPRDADSRTLANDLFRYLVVDPDIIYIENVEEFMSWGDLDDNGKPVHRKRGCDYFRWVNTMQGHGYQFDWRILNSADFGAYTARKRYFAQFVKPECILKWPEPTHSKNPDAGDLFQQLEKWNPVSEVLELEDHGKSIFKRKKHLSPKSIIRITKGNIKHIAGGQKQYLIKYNSMNNSGNYNAPGINEPSPFISTQNRIGLITGIQFLTKYYSGKPEHKNPGLDVPAPTLTTTDVCGLVTNQFMTVYHSNGGEIRSLDEPSPTIPTKDSCALISNQFILRDFKNPTNQAIDQPAGSLTANPKMNMVTSSVFLMDTQYNNGSRSLDNPAPVITANRKLFYLMNPQYMNNGGSINDPSFTLIARMDKMPPYLICCEEANDDDSNISFTAGMMDCAPFKRIVYGEKIAIVIQPTDTPELIELKQFMALYNIKDIYMRMLHIVELKRIQGFPDNYILLGTQAQQKKGIGNSVEVKTGKSVLETSAIANYPELMHMAV